jgi:pyruvate decarboxylase
MADLLSALAMKVPKKENCLKAYLRYSQMDQAATPIAAAAGESPLTLNEVRRQIQNVIKEDTSLVVETGDSWFIGQEMKLPAGAKYHFQMQYGSIGWATGATLGVALGVGKTRSVVSLIGDGSFQLTAQEVSTMIKHRVKCLIFLMNNRGYTIEVQIHDGPYNDIKNWDYAGLMEVFNAGEGDALGIKVQSGGELREAIGKAEKHSGVTLIEVVIDRDDCTAALLEFGSKVASANGRL